MLELDCGQPNYSLPIVSVINVFTAVACLCVERVERLETLHVVPSYITQYCLFYDHTHVHEDAW